ncbi:DUF2972 domain-containing protein, partial [Campylobacter novaezeelandiae]
PYPSLLDPNKLKDINEELNYHSIDANLAWELNLPLPDNYEFVFWGGHGVGNSGFHNFMRKNGLIAIPCTENYDGKINYFSFFNKILENKNQKIYIVLINYMQTNRKKLCTLIFPGKKISINLVRDPIGVIRNGISLTLKGKGFLDSIPFGMNPEIIFKNRVVYSGGGNFPNLNSIDNIINSPFKPFHDFILKKELINIKETLIIDMKEIAKDNAFETMKKLSKILDFNSPKKEDVKFYKTTFNDFRYLIPIHINMTNHLKSKNNIEIIFITSCYDSLYKNCIKINNIFSISNFYSLFITKNSYTFFKKYINKENIILIKNYIEKLITCFERVKEIEIKKKIQEKEILNHFKQNKEMALKFKKILDEEHLPYIKEQRPDIVKSWKYYQEFERMCEETIL